MMMLITRSCTAPLYQYASGLNHYARPMQETEGRSIERVRILVRRLFQRGMNLTGDPRPLQEQALFTLKAKKDFVT